MWEKEDLQRLQEAIFHRKSVRKFQSEALDPETIQEIFKKANEATPLFPEEPAAFRILARAEVKGIISAKAPHFLAVYAKQTPAALMNAAFLLQQMDLWLSARDLGCCWLGMPAPVAKLASVNGLPYAIMLAFGQPNEPFHRSRPEEFKRKNLDEITEMPNLTPLLEAVRLAPSSINRQPWYLTGDTKTIHLYGKQNGRITKKLYGNMPALDLGIALCHLWLAASAAGSFNRFEKAESAAPLRGYEYVHSLRLIPQQK